MELDGHDSPNLNKKTRSFFLVEEFDLIGRAQLSVL